MIKLFFTYYLISIAGVISFYAIGEFLLRVFRIRIAGVYVRVFSKLLLGALVFVLSCSLYFTFFKTVFFGILIALCYFFIGVYKKSTIPVGDEVDHWKDFRVLFQFSVVFTLFYTYRFYSISYNMEEIPNIPNNDFAYYARVSYYMVNLGIESTTPKLLFPENNEVDPYHYFDLWLTGGLSFITGGNNLLVLFLVNYTFGITLVWLGFCAIAESLNQLGFVALLISIGCTFLLPIASEPGISAHFLLSKTGFLLHAPPNYLTYSLWNMTKIYPVYLSFIAAILSFIKNERSLGVLILSLLSFIFSTIAIPILGTLSVYVIVDYFFLSKDKNFFQKFSIYLAFNYLFFIVFYILVPKELTSEFDPFSSLGMEPLYKTLFRPGKIFIDATFQLVLLFFPFVLLVVLMLCKKTSFKKIPATIYYKIRSIKFVSIAIILYVVSLLTWALLNRVDDSHQFFTTSAIVMLNIFCAIFFLYYRTVATFFFLIILTLILVDETTKGIFEQNLYNEDYLVEVSKAVRHTSGVGGYMFSKADYEIRHAHHFVEILGDYVSVFRADAYPVSLSIFDTHFGSARDSILIARRVQQSDFYRFTELQKSEGRYTSLDQSQIDFIERYKIGYLVISPDVRLSELLEEKVEKRIIDGGSGHIFLLLKR